MYRCMNESFQWPFRIGDGGGIERYDRRLGAWLPCIGTTDSYGYQVITYKPRGDARRFVRLHIVTWICHNGPIPEGLEVDHIDGDKRNSDISNLRLLTHQQNIMAARALQGNWSAVFAKLTTSQRALLLALPCSWRVLRALAARWNVSKFTLGNIRAKAKKENDPRYLAGL
jgi:hypothetical protein